MKRDFLHEEAANIFPHSSSLLITHSTQICLTTFIEAAHSHKLVYQRVPQPPSKADGTMLSNKAKPYTRTFLLQFKRQEHLPWPPFLHCQQTALKLQNNPCFLENPCLRHYCYHCCCQNSPNSSHSPVASQ